MEVLEHDLRWRGHSPFQRAVLKHWIFKHARDGLPSRRRLSQWRLLDGWLFPYNLRLWSLECCCDSPGTKLTLGALNIAHWRKIQQDAGHLKSKVSGNWKIIAPYINLLCMYAYTLLKYQVLKALDWLVPRTEKLFVTPPWKLWIYKKNLSLAFIGESCLCLKKIESSNLQV